MRIRQMSDLHLEFEPTFRPYNTNNADILMLNGDICMADLFNKSPDSPYYERGRNFIDFFEVCSKEYENVLYIPGNHEYYRGYIDTADDIIREALKSFTNIHFLNNQSWEKDGVTFLGATLWTDMNHSNPITEDYLRNSMNDFRVVKWKKDSYGGSFRPSDAASFHRRTMKYFDEASTGLDNVVIMSHHAPSFNSVHSKYHNDTQMNYGYYSALDGFIIDRPQIKLWTHGHMHDCFDYMIGSTRVVCNPRGYNDENRYFKDGILEL